MLSFLRFALSVLSPSDLVHEGLELTRMNTSRHPPLFYFKKSNNHCRCNRFLFRLRQQLSSSVSSPTCNGNVLRLSIPLCLMVSFELNLLLLRSPSTFSRMVPRRLVWILHKGSKLLTKVSLSMKVKVRKQTESFKSIDEGERHQENYFPDCWGNIRCFAWSTILGPNDNIILMTTIFSFPPAFEKMVWPTIKQSENTEMFKSKLRYQVRTWTW